MWGRVSEWIEEEKTFEEELKDRQWTWEPFESGFVRDPVNETASKDGHE